MILSTSSSSSSSSYSSAAVRVEKATSDLLIAPDWTMNIDICDSINSNHWQGKDVLKAVKKRLQHKNPNVQLLSLTLLETMVKNCGEYVHFQIAERNILPEMIKIVKKRSDMRVREKILLLLDSWQEAFGGREGKYSQYYWAYDELRCAGVQFPKRSSDAAPIFTPPVSHPTAGHPQAGYGMPSNSSRRLDEAMASEIESLSLSSLDMMRGVMELLNDMLQAVNPSDRMAIKDELIFDLVSQSRSNQKKLMQMLTSTGDEELLSLGLDLNDSLQNVLARHDAIASGLPLPALGSSFNPQPTIKSSNLAQNEERSSSLAQNEERSSSLAQNEERSSSPRPNLFPLPAPVAAVARNKFEEEEEEEDDFALLARRHSKPGSVPSQTMSNGTNGGPSSLILTTTTPEAPVDPITSPSNALTLPDPPAPVRTTKEQDIMDLLSITLSTTSTSPHTPNTPQTVHQAPVSPSTQGYPYASHAYPGNQGQVPYNSYVVPWAQPQPQSQPQPQPLFRPQYYQPQSQQQQQQPQSPLRPQYPQYAQPQPQVQPPRGQQSQVQAQQPQYTQAYPLPPWATTPGYANNQIPLSNTNSGFASSQAHTSGSFAPVIGARTLQSHNSFPAKGSEGSAVMQGNPQVNSHYSINHTGAGQKPFIPSYRLFEDIDVFGNADGRVKTTSGTSPSLSRPSGPGMVGGRQ